MKSGLKLFVLSFILMFALVVKVNAEEINITDGALLEICVLTSGNVCKLSNDIVLVNSIEVGKQITIDLNGFDIAAADTMTDDSLIIVLHGGTLTIKGNGSVSATNANSNARIAVKMSKGGNTTEFIKDNPATLILESGTLEGTSFGISGNGNPDRVNTDVIINDGVINGGSTGIYHPQSGCLTIHGGTITGKTGIEMRAGILSIDGGTITGTAMPDTSIGNGNGSTTEGVGIAISQHTTKLPVEVNVTGGTIKGYKALVQVNTLDNATKEDLEKIALNIEDGTFETINGGTVAVESENVTEFISGGTFSSGVEKEYLVTDIKLEEQEDGSFVAKNYYLIFIDEDIKNGSVTSVEKAYSGDVVELNIKPDAGYKVSKITVMDHLDREIEVTDNSFTMPNSPVMVKVNFIQDEKVPNTADNVLIFVIIAIIGLIGTCLTVNRLRKNA